MDTRNIYNDPILGKRRKGTPDDPFLHIQETLQIVKGKVGLTETPNRMNKVKVSSEGETWFEIQGESKDNLFNVDYSQGVVFFDSIHNGKSLTFTYLGEGVELIPSDRVYLEGEEEPDILTVRDKFDNVDTAILEQKNRVDEQMRSVPQPSEVVDMRIDHNGNIFPVAKDRIDAEQIKIEEAYKDKNGKVYPSLQERIIGEQVKIEEAYRDKNSVVHPSLKKRIDAEQFKIEEAYEGADGNTYTSLKDRFDSVDVLTSSHHRRLANSVADMKTKNYKIGEYVLTLGYYGMNDGGHAEYYISNKAENSADITLNNGLFAHLIIGETINPLQLGARGNNDNDDSVGLQLALTLAKELGGGKVVVPYGKYSLKKTLVIYKNTSLIVDQGAELIRNHTGYLLMNGETASQFTEYSGNGNILIQGGIWDGKGANFENASTIIAIGHGENIIVKDVIIKDVVNTHALEVNSSKNVLVDNCKFIGFRTTNGRAFSEAINIDKATAEGFPAFGSHDNTACKNVTIQNCYFGKSNTVGMNGWGRGIGTHSADQAAGDKHTKITIKNNNFENVVQWAVYVSHWDDANVVANKITSCGGGIRVAPANQPMYRIMVNDNIILDSGDYGLANISIVGTVDYEVRTVDCSNNIIYAVSAASVSGIYAAYCNGCKIDGNSIRNTDTDAITVRYGRYYSIVNNSIVSCSGSGIYLWTNILYSNVVNNQIGYVGLNGIHITNNIDTIVVASNSISGINGKKTSDANHIRVTDKVDRISLANNVCRDIQADYIATLALYITNTCTNVSRTGNIFAGIAGGISDGSGSKVTGDLI